MLEEAVQKAKGEEIEVEKVTKNDDVRVDFQESALFPNDYIDDSDLRYNFYRKISSAKDLDTIGLINEELKDRFGELPEPARNLIILTRLKVMGNLAGFKRISIRKKMLTATLALPKDPVLSQKSIGKLVSQAEPQKIEFKLGANVDLIYRFKMRDTLKETENFLRHLTREGILRD